MRAISYELSFQILFGDLKIFVINTKHPHCLIIQFTVSEYFNNWIKKIFVFEHPKNVWDIKDTTVKDILILNKLQDFLFVTWPQDVIKRTHCILSLKFLNHNILLGICFRND